MKEKSSDDPGHLMIMELSNRTCGLLPSFLFNFWWHQEAFEILVPPLRVEPVPLAVEAQSNNHWSAREVPGCLSEAWLWTREIKFFPVYVTIALGFLSFRMETAHI